MNDDLVNYMRIHWVANMFYNTAWVVDLDHSMYSLPVCLAVYVVQFVPPRVEEILHYQLEPWSHQDSIAVCSLC